MARHAASTHKDFWALRNVSFALRRGESLALVGRNGSGKSTLLQIIAGTLQPSSGRVSVHGRVAALLELGSGFNPDFSGRDNVFLNAAVLGLTSAEIDARYNTIVAFAEIGPFIDQPVKTYSSGMMLRLAFAVAVHVDPEILIIDEALAVGDARFQLKCARAIDRFVARGVTLLFVSHDLSSVKRLCRQAILIEGGQLLYQGTPNDVGNLYSKLIADGGSAEAIAPDIATLQSRSVEVSPTPAKAPVPAPQGDDALTRKQAALLQDEREHVSVSGREFAYGGKLGRINGLDLLDQEGRPRTAFASGETVIVRCTVESFENLADPVFALTVRNSTGLEIYGTNTLFSGQPAGPINAGEKRLVSFRFPLNLMAGDYFLSFGFTHFFGDELMVIQRRYDAIKLEVHGVDRTFGIANLHARIEVSAASSAASPP